MNTADSSTSSVSRRSLLKAAGWAAPAIVLTTAAPAAVASTNEPTPVLGPPIEVSSDSWRGGRLGSRNDVANYNIRVTVTAPEGYTMSGATATLTFSKNLSGGQIYAYVSGTGTITTDVEGWTTTKVGQMNALSSQYSQWIYTTEDELSGTDAKLLSFEISWTGYMEEPSIGELKIESTGLTPVTYTLLTRNKDGQILVPA